MGFTLRLIAGLVLLVPFLPFASANENVAVLTTPSKDADSVTIASVAGRANVVLDAQDYPVVQVAADLFADDIRRVTGKRPLVLNTPAGSREVIIVGTLGKSSLIQKLVAAGKLKGVDQIRGRWEATLTEVVIDPMPGVDRALVIAGSDRRGAAYGLMEISRKMGVSPWYWWADVPIPHHDVLTVKVSAPQMNEPGVKYRGIFINDEDWGMNPWASKTFDPTFKNIGPKTYEKVFELMLRLRLNYLWPAMHPCSTEFASVPENAALADKYGIVAGASHCEPMLCNNVHWHEREKGPWNYSLNRDAIRSYWEDSVKARGADEAVWTLGIRGIHDQGMQAPPEGMTDRINLMSQIFQDQRDLLGRKATKEWGPVAQCFVPYKEVLPIYDAGLKVPDDVTLVWVDDNFGYIRRVSSPEERTRPGGSGVYWHLSYYGWPHSYTWLNSTAPALIWEELHKAWENDARTIWVINVGDIKPMEIGIDYFSRLSWNPGGFPLGAQRRFLNDFSAENFNPQLAPQMADLLMDFYRLGSVRKPELMERRWAVSLTSERAKELEDEYQKLLDREQALARVVPGNARDAYTELIGFPARVLGLSGLIFLADRRVQEGRNISVNEKKVTDLRHELEAQVVNYNTKIAFGKWNRMMPGLKTGGDLMAWNSQVRWPWGEKPRKNADRPAESRSGIPDKNGRDAATADRQPATGDARWYVVEGLGPSGRAVALLPASLSSSWKESDPKAPALEFDFTSKGGDAEVGMDFLPTYRLYPGMKLRVAVRMDGGESTVVEVPGSNGAENENGQLRSQGVQDNYIRARVSFPALPAGKHTFKIAAVDPGAVVDRVYLPRQ